MVGLLFNYRNVHMDMSSLVRINIVRSTSIRGSKPDLVKTPHEGTDTKSDSNVTDRPP